MSRLELLGVGRKLEANGREWAGTLSSRVANTLPDAYTGALRQFLRLPVPVGVSSPGDERVSQPMAQWPSSHLRDPNV